MWLHYIFEEKNYINWYQEKYVFIAHNKKIFKGTFKIKINFILISCFSYILLSWISWKLFRRNFIKYNISSQSLFKNLTQVIINFFLF